jgi:hypothetical protein
MGMKFSYNGQEYRIVFKHDPPQDLGAHRGHELAIASVNGMQRVCCVECHPDGWGRPLPLWPISPKRDARNTDCFIQIRLRDSWETIWFGRSKVNLSAGDRFCKKAGREASLANALGFTFAEAYDGSFEDHAWACYDAASPVSYGVVLE